MPRFVAIVKTELTIQAASFEEACELLAERQWTLHGAVKINTEECKGPWQSPADDE